eukprot:TRINITY_DN3605_c0_g1_i1.p1 TRINITY_DN3605_c0_g1~~TRINITY_DN3605_c0_g1_i1.p1  ORF type:complete len:197 (-),score=42.23 TRINITY_DN3605_c0_g1_i1:103-693(-)
MGSKDQEGGIFGWRNWTLPDEWTTIHRDRTPKEPKENEYGHHGSGPQWTMGEVPVIGGDKNPVRHSNLTIADHLLRYWTPFLKTFFTDMGANVMSAQGQRCGDFEIRAMECIEYYGSKQGMTACKDWYDDFMECQMGAKQRLRMRAMFKKRHIDMHMEYLQGKRTWDETYEKPPKYHAYVEPWYNEKWAHVETCQN